MILIRLTLVRPYSRGIEKFRTLQIFRPAPLLDSNRPDDNMNLALIGNAALRAAIQRNLVSFPAQIPAFRKGGNEQRRIVQLYFIRGWQTRAICDRYQVSKWAVRTALLEWKIRAVAAGYIQDIHPEALALLAVQENDDSDLSSAEALRSVDRVCSHAPFSIFLDECEAFGNTFVPQGGCEVDNRILSVRSSPQGSS
jgi:hypothetical protein